MINEKKVPLGEYEECLIQGTSELNNLFQLKTKEAINAVQNLDPKKIIDTSKTVSDLHKKFMLNVISFDKSDRKIEPIGSTSNTPNEKKNYRVSYKYSGTDHVIPYCSLKNDLRDYSVNYCVHINVLYKRMALIFKLASYDADTLEEMITNRFSPFFSATTEVNSRIEKFNIDLVCSIQEAVKVKVADDQQHKDFLQRMNSK